MARELVYTGFMSLDGVVDSPGGTTEGHRSGGWVLQTPFVPEAYSLKAEEIEETSALMFGRRSYDAFAPVWPKSEDHAAYKELPKYVVSTSLGADEPVGDWGRSRSCGPPRTWRNSSGARAGRSSSTAAPSWPAAWRKRI
ncbi:dihydrofolate reductase family protein [Nocardiopsis composta]